MMRLILFAILLLPAALSTGSARSDAADALDTSYVYSATANADGSVALLVSVTFSPLTVSQAMCERRMGMRQRGRSLGSRRSDHSQGWVDGACVLTASEDFANISDYGTYLRAMHSGSVTSSGCTSQIALSIPFQAPNPMTHIVISLSMPNIQTASPGAARSAGSLTWTYNRAPNQSLSVEMSATANIDEPAQQYQVRLTAKRSPPLPDYTLDHRQEQFSDSVVLGSVEPVSINFRIMAACRQNKWHAALLAAEGDYALQARLLPGSAQVTGPGGNTMNKNFCAQVHDLKHLDAHSAWSMLQATVVHEEVHEKHVLPALLDAAPNIATMIEGLNIPAAQLSREDAINALQKLSSYAKVRDDALKLWRARYISLAHDDHSGPTAAAEQSVIQPIVESICRYAKSRNWGSCADCGN